MSLELYSGIDPGTDGSWLAWGERHTLLGVYCIPKDHIPPLPTGMRLLIEKPRIYPYSNGEDPNDLIDLAIALGGLRLSAIHAGVDVTLCEPRKWKGQRKKPPHHLSIWQALTHAEREVVAKAIGHTQQEIFTKINDACETLARTGKIRKYAWDAHNAFDAVGIYLKHAGRSI